VFWGTCKCIGREGGYGALGNWNWIRHTRVGGVFATPRLHGMYRRIIKWADIFQNYFHNFSTTLI
jgi:hypothetical protein